MIETEMTHFFINNGVAVGVLAWFMFRMERVIKNNTDALKRVEIAVATCPSKKKD